MPVTFIWPGLLWGLLLVPAVLALYARLLRRALPASLPHPVTPLVAIAASHGNRFTRYLPAAAGHRHPPLRRPEQHRHRSAGGRRDRSPPRGHGVHRRRGTAVYAGQRVDPGRVARRDYAAGDRSPDRRDVSSRVFG